MHHSPAPALSPTRARLEQLLSRLARSYVESLGPMERAMVASLTRARGWDFDHLASGRGPLAPVSDWALEVLVGVFADELHAVLDEPPMHLRPASRDAALAELKDALA